MTSTDVLEHRLNELEKEVQDLRDDNKKLRKEVSDQEVRRLKAGIAALGTIVLLLAGMFTTLFTDVLRK